jgi:hypothetical protein
LERQALGGVVEKHDFHDTQQKNPQISDFAKKWDSNPLPHGDVVAGIAKCLQKIFRENRILHRKTRFSQ